VFRVLRSKGLVVLGLCMAGVAGAADNAIVSEARALLAALATDDAPSPFVAGAVDRAKRALERADALGAEGAPKYRELLQATGLDWAKVARDLQRTLASEQAADAVEAELSKVQTDLVRAHAAVEQAMARLGRARAEIETLQASARPAPASAPGAPAAAPEPATAAPPARRGDEAVGD
jgi:multidrug resistance efflux pump